MTSIALIGAGPRGASLIERIAAYRPSTPLELHVIDDAPFGAGRIWDPAQSRTLCMNTLAGAVTLFTEPGASVGAPILEGPTLYQWIQQIRGERDTLPAAARHILTEYPPAPELAEHYPEIATLRPESHPSRALYGEYLRWFYRLARAELPQTVRLIEHQCRAVRVQATNDGRDRIELSDGTIVLADASVLALGWIQPEPQVADGGETGAPAGEWIPPASPIEQDLSGIAPGETVLIRGLGMSFFDAMVLLTEDRGGRFEHDPHTRSGLRYIPSGNEPHLVVGSRRGYPFMPKSRYGGLPPRPFSPRFDSLYAELQGRDEPIDFATTVWPTLIADAAESYARTLDRVGAFPTEPSHHEFDPTKLFYPLAGIHGSPEQVTEHIADAIHTDIRAAERGADSAFRAGLWTLSANRKRVSILGADGRYTPASRPLLREYQALGGMVGSGPPLVRSRQLLALIDANLVTLLGAGTTVQPTEGGFIMHSDSVPGHTHWGRVLLDARMHSFDLHTAADPLCQSLTDSARWTEFETSGSPTTCSRTRRLIHADGTSDPRLHLVGIPTGGQHPDTTISPLPGTDALFLQETDAAAASALRSAGIDLGYFLPSSVESAATKAS